MSTPGVGDEGTLSGLHIALVIIGGTIGMAVFLVSAQIGGALGLQKAGLAFLIGSLILALFGSLTSFVGARTRSTTYELCESAFGGRGAKLVNSLIALSLLGWFAVISNTLGALSEFVFSNLYGWTLSPTVYVVISSVAIIGVTASGFRGGSDGFPFQYRIFVRQYLQPLDSDPDRHFARCLAGIAFHHQDLPRDYQ